MLRNLLLVLDGSTPCTASIRFAMSLAARTAARVTALGIVDSESIDSPGPIPIGGMAYQDALERSLIEAATVRVQASLDQAMAEAGAIGQTLMEARAVQGDAFPIIAAEAVMHDLIVVARDAQFDVDEPEDEEHHQIARTLDRLIRAASRPIIMVPTEALSAEEQNGPVIVGFDGSPAASHAIHMFALLQLFADMQVQVVTTRRDDAENVATAGCKLLSRHGYRDPRAIPFAGEDAAEPAEAILATAAGAGASMIVMGAYGHSALRELFGSCTASVIEGAKVPLFLHR